jgi:proteasome lid subunit RPN8/RPN11
VPCRPAASKKTERHQRDFANGVFLHNHSSGDPTPSQADIQMTKAIVRIITPLANSEHDHIIVGNNGHASLRGPKLISRHPHLPSINYPLRALVNA